MNCSGPCSPDSPLLWLHAKFCRLNFSIIFGDSIPRVWIQRLMTINICHWLISVSHNIPYATLCRLPLSLSHPSGLDRDQLWTNCRQSSFPGARGPAGQVHRGHEGETLRCWLTGAPGICWHRGGVHRGSREWVPGKDARPGQGQVLGQVERPGLLACDKYNLHSGWERGAYIQRQLSYG